MLYQLPNGKTINLSIDEFLSLTDADIQNIIAENRGFYSNPRKTSFKYEEPDQDEEVYYIDESMMNCDEEEDELCSRKLKDILDNLPDED